MNLRGFTEGSAIILILLGALLLMARVSGQPRPSVQRYGMIIGLKPEKIVSIRRRKVSRVPIIPNSCSPARNRVGVKDVEAIDYQA